MSTVVDSLANGAVLVHNAGNGVWDEGTRWRLVERYRVGNRADQNEDFFTLLWALTSDAADRLYALDRNAPQLRVYDSTGSLVRTLGRLGDGPGEFRNPTGLTWDNAGRLWVLDPLRARYVVYDTSGIVEKEYPRRVLGFTWPWAAWFDEAGYLYEQLFPRDRSKPVGRFRVDEDLVLVDTIRAGFEGIGGWDFWDLRGKKSPIVAIPIPFGRGPRWTIDPHGYLWVGHSSSYVIARRSIRGDTVLVVERSAQPVPITRSERDSAAFPYAKNELLDLSLIPTTKPFFEQLAVDPANHLWVLRAGPGNTWFFDVFASDGKFMGSLDLPVSPWLDLPPRIGRDKLWVASSDSMDVQSIVCYEIVRGGQR